MNKLPEHIIIQYGKRQLNISIVFEQRKTIRLTVYPDKSILAKFPYKIDPQTAKQYLQNKAKWINDKVKYFDQYHPMPVKRQYIRGESYYYMGRQYQLDIKKQEENDVKMKHGHIIVYTPDPYNSDKVKELLLEWYRDHAIKYIDKRIELIAHSFEKMGYSKPDIKYRRMKTRWGSCKHYKNKKPLITINTELIKAPIDCIDYVIVHEFIHLKHNAHDRNFYNMLDTLLSDWKKRRARLNHVYVID